MLKNKRQKSKRTQSKSLSNPKRKNWLTNKGQLLQTNQPKKQQTKIKAILKIVAWLIPIFLGFISPQEFQWNFTNRFQNINHLNLHL